MQNMPTGTPAAREHIQAQMDFLTDVSKNVFQTAQRFNEANMKVMQSIFAETVSKTQQIMHSSPQQALLVASEIAQPAAETINAFNANIANIFAQGQEEIAKTAEQHIPKTTQAARALVQDVNKMTEEARNQASERGKQAYEHISTLIEKIIQRCRQTDRPAKPVLQVSLRLPNLPRSLPRVLLVQAKREHK